MNAQTPLVERSRLPALVAGGSVKAIVPQDFESAWRMAGAIHASGMMPYGIDTQAKAMVAIMHGLEIGLTPMNAMQSIAVINGKPTVYGDAAIGLVRASGLMEWIKETIEGEGDAQTARCTVKRKNEAEPIVGEFSVADAKTAGLWTKTGKSGAPSPWQTYPKRMLKFRARAFALRDGFADVLKGMHIREEVEDYATNGNGKTVEHDDGPPAPPPEPVTGSPATAPIEPDPVDADFVEADDGPPVPTEPAAEEASFVDLVEEKPAEVAATTTKAADGPPDPLDIPADLRRASPQTERLKNNLLRDIATLDSIEDFAVWARDAQSIIDGLPTASQTEIRTAFSRRQDEVKRAEGVKA